MNTKRRPPAGNTASTPTLTPPSSPHQHQATTTHTSPSSPTTSPSPRHQIKLLVFEFGANWGDNNYKLMDAVEYLNKLGYDSYMLSQHECSGPNGCHHIKLDGVLWDPLYEKPPLANIMSVVKEYDVRVLDILMGKDQFIEGADEQFEKGGGGGGRMPPAHMIPTPNLIAEIFGSPNVGGSFPGEEKCVQEGLAAG